MTRPSSRPIAGLFAAGILIMGAVQAEAAIKVTSASISGGKLVLTGKSPTGTSVKLDGRYTARINAADRTFKFSIPYLPTDCKVELTLAGATSPAVTAVIALCGQAGPAYIGRQVFAETVMSLQAGTTLSILGFSFTPPVTGNALIHGRGHCIVAGAAGASTKFQIYAAPSLATVPSKADIGPVRVNEDPDSRDHLTNWTFESSLPVSENVAKTVLVNYAVVQAAVAQAECSGSVTVEVVNGNLPLVALP